MADNIVSLLENYPSNEMINQYKLEKYVKTTSTSLNCKHMTLSTSYHNNPQELSICEHCGNHIKTITMSVNKETPPSVASEKHNTQQDNCLNKIAALQKTINNISIPHIPTSIKKFIPIKIMDTPPSYIQNKQHNYTTKIQMYSDKSNIVDGFSESCKNETSIEVNQTAKSKCDGLLPKKRKKEYQLHGIQNITQIENIKNPKIVPSCLEKCNQPIVTDNNENNFLNNYTCDYCSKLFTKLPSLKSHIRNIHNSMLSYQCNLCDKRQPSKKAAMIHSQFHDTLECHPCKCCKMVFYKSTFLQKHMITNHGKLYQCNQCEKSYKWPLSLKYHKKNVHYDSTNNELKSKMQIIPEGQVKNTNFVMQLFNKNQDHSSASNNELKIHIQATPRQLIKNNKIDFLPSNSLIKDNQGLLKNNSISHIRTTEKQQTKNTHVDLQQSNIDKELLEDELLNQIETKNINIDLQQSKSILKENQNKHTDELKSQLGTLEQQINNNKNNLQPSNSIIKINQGLPKDEIKSKMQAIPSKETTMIHSQLYDTLECHPCKCCKMVFYKSTLLKKHMITNHGKLYQCNQCEKSYKWPSSLKYHTKNVHYDSTNNKLNSKMQAIPSKETTMIHSQLHDTFECHPCKCCKMVFYKSTLLKKHMITNHDKLYQCNQCEKSYKWPSSLKYHTKNVHYDSTNNKLNSKMHAISKEQIRNTNFDMQLFNKNQDHSSTFNNELNSKLQDTHPRQIKNANIGLQISNCINKDNQASPKNKLKSHTQVSSKRQLKNLKIVLHKSNAIENGQHLHRYELRSHFKITPRLLEIKNANTNLKISNTIAKYDQDSLKDELKTHMQIIPRQVTKNNKIDLQPSNSIIKNNQGLNKNDSISFIQGTTKQQTKNTNIDLQQSNIDNGNQRLDPFEELNSYIIGVAKQIMINDNFKGHKQTTPKRKKKNNKIVLQKSNIIESNQCLPIDELIRHMKLIPERQIKNTSLELQLSNGIANNYPNKFEDIKDWSFEEELTPQQQIKIANKTCIDAAYCDICDILFKTHVSLFGHNNLLHNKRKQEIKCYKCSIKFDSLYSLHYHQNIEHDAIKFHCDYCNKCFYLRKQLQNHLLLHQTTKQFSCFLCWKDFLTVEEYAVHNAGKHELFSFIVLAARLI